MAELAARILWWIAVRFEVQRSQLLRGTVSEHRDQGRVRIEYSAVGRGAVNACGDVLEETPVALLALTQRLFRPLPLPAGFLDGAGHDIEAAGKPHQLVAAGQAAPHAHSRRVV